MHIPPLDFKNNNIQDFKNDDIQDLKKLKHTGP